MYSLKDLTDHLDASEDDLHDLLRSELTGARLPIPYIEAESARTCWRRRGGGTDVDWPEGELWTPDELAECWGVPRRTVDHLVERGELAVDTRKVWRVTSDQLEAYEARDTVHDLVEASEIVGTTPRRLAVAAQAGAVNFYFEGAHEPRFKRSDLESFDPDAFQLDNGADVVEVVYFPLPGDPASFTGPMGLDHDPGEPFFVPRRWAQAHATVNLMTVERLRRRLPRIDGAFLSGWAQAFGVLEDGEDVEDGQAESVCSEILERLDERAQLDLVA